MKKILFSFLIFITIASFGLLKVEPVHALTISPLRQAISIEPGSKKSVTVELKNDSQERKKFQAEVRPFTIDQEGDIKYSGRDKAKNWLIYNKNPFILQPNKSKEVSFTVNVPNRAKPKSHYLVLFIKEVGVQQNFSASAGAGSLLFLHVAGTRTEKLELDEFSSSKDFYFNKPAKVTLQLKNKGSIHVIPAGQISLLDGEKLIDRKNLNKNEDLVLPTGQFKESFSFEDLNWTNAGKLTAVAYLKYGRTSKPLSTQVEFWYIPPLLTKIAISIVTVILLTIIILKIYPRFRKNV